MIWLSKQKNKLGNSHYNIKLLKRVYRKIKDVTKKSSAKGKRHADILKSHELKTLRKVFSDFSVYVAQLKKTKKVLL